MTDSKPTFLPVSVVIPTLGGPSLMRTIDHLVEDDRPPQEILVCVPSDAWGQRVQEFGSTVRVLTLPFRGQVRQRIAGFEAATQPYVLQCDDDLVLGRGSLPALVSALRTTTAKAAVAPVYVLEDGRAYARFPRGGRGLLADVSATVLHGAKWGTRRMGTIAASGQNFGVDASAAQEPILEVDWLPGGCVLHRRDDLLLENYYPFAGKAYAEDLLHSELLRSRGIRLLVARDAKCQIRIEREAIAVRQRIQKHRAEHHAARKAGAGPVWSGVRLMLALLRDVRGLLLRTIRASFAQPMSRSTSR